MRKLTFIISFFLSAALFCSASILGPNGSSTDKQVIVSGMHGVHPHACEPIVIFNLSTSMLSINFGNQPIGNYTVTISSPSTDIDYYATSSFTTIPLAIDGIFLCIKFVKSYLSV